MRNVSIKDIAKFVGVSTATVSRVINNNGRFSEDTRKKVLEALDKFDYHTNVVARSLRTQISNCIGVIVPDITNEFFAEITLAIENCCFPKGYSVFVCNTNEDEAKEKIYLKELESKGVDGLICLSCRSNLPIQATKRNIPVVCIDRGMQDKTITSVESDNYTGGFLATEELIKQGCKRIIMLKDYRNIMTMANRFKGYLDALNKYGIPVDLNNVYDIYDIPVNVNTATKNVLKIIDDKIAFDGIFAGTDWLALGALNALKKRNITVPGEVKLVGFDNISITEYSYPPITTINQDKQKMGEEAAVILLEGIESKSYIHKNVIVPVELVKRKTT